MRQHKGFFLPLLQGQARVRKDGLQFIEQDMNHRPIGLDQLDALVGGQLAAIDGLDDRCKAAARLDRLGQRQRINPGAGLFRIDLDFPRQNLGRLRNNNAQCHGLPSRMDAF
ncbi:MAG TPA: hypothetical protein VFV17_02285 [Usitatibacteraceae bacterium]|nr:hypothetical protein [Usitatibacteraceae bacterium]